MNKRLLMISKQLKDERNKRIIFVSHCILNENARYLGGAFCSSLNKTLLDNIIMQDCGIVQMPCPEQNAWGGVLKKMIWLPIDTNKSPRYFFLMLMYPFFIAFTYLVYNHMAAKVVKQIKDYLNSGFEVLGIIGIDGSPTCGYNKSISLSKSFKFTASLEMKTLSRENYNKNLYGTCIKHDKGLFMKLLTDKLKRKKLKIKIFAIDLEKEMNREKLKVFV